jgi:rubrerythrin
MDSEKAVDILKQALLIEKKGNAFYRQVASTARHPEVKQFFETMAAEEVRHIEILSEQYKAYHENSQFASMNYSTAAAGSAVDKVLTQDLVEAMQAADFEAAAVTAAVAMEKNAIKLYGARAAEATDPEEKALYEWLTQWEKSHLTFLADLESELTQKVWFDQSFWPF